MAPTTPEPVERPKLALWMWTRKVKPRDAAKRLGVTTEAVRRYCLEFGHPDRQIPGRKVLEAVHAWTEGEITPSDFYPPHLNTTGPVSQVAP